MSVCFIFRRGQDTAHQLAETVFSSDFPKCIGQMFSAAVLLPLFVCSRLLVRCLVS